MTLRLVKAGMATLKANCCLLNSELLAGANPESNLGPEQG